MTYFINIIAIAKRFSAITTVLYQVYLFKSRQINQERLFKQVKNRQECRIMIDKIKKAKTGRST